VQQRPGLTALSASYLDFVVRQRSVAGSQAGKAQLRYWMEELQGDLPVLQLPTDNVRPPQQTFNGAGHTVEFSAGFSAQYLAFCRQQGVTPFVLGLALYSVLLHRFSNQNEFLVATPCAGRDGSEFMDLVGYFVNPLPLRVQLEDDPAFSDFLQHIDRKIRQALQHQDIPFATLVEKRQLKRDPSYPVLCQAMFVHQKQPAGANRIGFGSGHYDWGLLRARHYPLHQQEGQFDVSLEVLEGDNSLAAHWKYNADLFAPDTIASMAAIFEQLALDVFADAERKLSALRLIHAADCDRYRLPPQATFPVQHSLQETFSRIARQHGEQVAIVHEGVQLSYRQLEDRSNALAQAILQQGTQPGEAVGILLERSIDLVASLLAVLKAGCCYVPLDPTYPSDRLHYMTADAGARVVVTSRNNVAEADALKLQPLYVEDVPAIPAPGLQLPPTEKHQLAYILYTSGSTGRPKGVKVSHGNVLRLFDATQGIYGFDHTDVWT
jgi:non-ribosomal peptide synthetase component F